MSEKCRGFRAIRIPQWLYPVLRPNSVRQRKEKQYVLDILFCKSLGPFLSTSHPGISDARLSKFAGHGQTLRREYAWQSRSGHPRFFQVEPFEWPNFGQTWHGLLVGLNQLLHGLSQLTFARMVLAPFEIMTSLCLLHFGVHGYVRLVFASLWPFIFYSVGLLPVRCPQVLAEV